MCGPACCLLFFGQVHNLEAAHEDEVVRDQDVRVLLVVPPLGGAPRFVADVGPIPSGGTGHDVRVFARALNVPAPATALRRDDGGGDTGGDHEADDDAQEGQDEEHSTTAGVSAFGREQPGSAHDDDQLHDEGYGEDEDRDAELDAWGEAGGVYGGE